MPGSIVAPQLPSPSPNRCALVNPRSPTSSMKRALSALRMTRTTLGSCPNLFGTPGRVAAGHDDSRGGIGASHAPDGLSRPLIGGGRHRAGVHDDEISLLGGTAIAPAACSSSSKPSESAWFTRQPKVTTEYFTRRTAQDRWSSSPRATSQSAVPACRCLYGIASRRRKSVRHRRRPARWPSRSRGRCRRRPGRARRW